MAQFPAVSCTYGAPMGRHAFGIPENCDEKTIRLFKVRLDSGGYDDGGAYWGNSFSAGPLYCATDGTGYRQFARARSRAEAAAALDIEPQYLKRKI